jgi:DNA-directed RNA polymerase specialized sigma24 family protein
MSELSKKVNQFFNFTPKSEIDKVTDNLIISPHLKQVLEMRYIEGKDIEYIAFKTGYSRGKIESDLRKLRKKIEKLI